MTHNLCTSMRECVGFDMKRLGLTFLCWHIWSVWFMQGIFKTLSQTFLNHIFHGVLWKPNGRLHPIEYFLSTSQCQAFDQLFCGINWVHVGETYSNNKRCIHQHICYYWHTNSHIYINKHTHIFIHTWFFTQDWISSKIHFSLLSAKGNSKPAGVLLSPQGRHTNSPDRISLEREKNCMRYCLQSSFCWQSPWGKGASQKSVRLKLSVSGL